MWRSKIPNAGGKRIRGSWSKTIEGLGEGAVARAGEVRMKDKGGITMT